MVAESKPPLGGSIWILSLFIAILAVLLQRSYGESGPFVAVFVFAAFLAIGLPFRQFSWLLSLLALLLVVPLFFESGNSSDVSQVLIGVACLASIVVYRGIVLEPGGDEGPLSSLSSTTSRCPERLRSDVCDPLNVDRGVGFSNPSDPLFLTEDLATHLHPSESGCRSTLEPFSLGAGSPDDHFRPVLDRLSNGGHFSETQLTLVGNALQSLDLSRAGQRGSVVLFRGQRIGSFIVEAPLGRGGEGTIYHVRDSSGRNAALKILHNMHVSDRFRREMEMVRKLAHRNIVTAYEVGELDGVPFIAMELLQGPDLNQLIKRKGKLDWRTATKYMMQIAQALSHAHRRELVHRDVKPSNMLLDGFGGVKLVDLGLATRSTHDDSGCSVFQFETQEGQLAGTIPYMSPEQGKSLAHANHLSDIYSLGASWFYLLTGSNRLRGTSLGEQFNNLLIYRDFDELESGLLPLPLWRVYERMVAYDPGDRYGSCEELVEALSGALLELGEEIVLSNHVHVLVVEDSRSDLILTMNLLRKSNPSLKMHHAATLAEAFEICGEVPIDMVLLDLHLPDGRGIETIRRFRKAHPSIPVAVLTGACEEEAETEAVSAGADSFLSKDGLTAHRMERTIFVTLSRCRALSEELIQGSGFGDGNTTSFELG